MLAVHRPAWNVRFMAGFFVYGFLLTSELPPLGYLLTALGGEVTTQVVPRTPFCARLR